MVIAPEAANLFICEYSRLLAHVYAMQGGGFDEDVLTVLASGRAAIAADAALFARAVNELEQANQALAPAVLDAVATLKLSRWIYLRDTTRYSAFLDAQGDNAYAVRGLSHPVRGITGGAGAILDTGLVQYGGYIVCDGIVSNAMWLGPNLQRDYSSLLAKAKTKGRFHTRAFP